MALGPAIAIAAASNNSKLAIAARVMAEVGLLLDGHHARPLSDYMGQVHVGHVFTVCADAERNGSAVFLGMGQWAHRDFEDPAAFVGSEEETLAKFRQVRDQIDARIEEWLAAYPTT